jgi:hypothetical protein
MHAFFASRWLRGVDGNVKNITEKEIFKGQATNLRKGGNFRKMLPCIRVFFMNKVVKKVFNF